MICAPLVLASPALAQGVPGGLFGGTRPDAGGRNTLSLQLSMSEALDSDVSPEFRAVVPGNDLKVGRHSSLLTGSIDYVRERQRVRLSGSASTFVRYSHRLASLAPGAQDAQLGARVRLPRRGTIEITQAVAYSPSYLYELFPVDAAQAAADVAPANPEFRIIEAESYLYRTRMTLTYGSERGTRFTSTANYGLADFRKARTPRPDLTTYGIETRVAHAFSRTSGVSVGYEYRTGEFDGAPRSKGHELPLGLSYSPALSPTRRLAISLEVTPTMIDVPAAPEEDATETAPANGERRRFPVQGNVSLTYPFGLRWRATAGVRRSVEHLALLGEPVVSDGAHVRVAGLLGRRVDVSVSGRSARAESAGGRAGRRLDSHTGEARVRFALTRSFALYAEYLYYYYDLGDLAGRAPGLPGTYEQQGVRVGFTLFATPIGR